MYSLEHNIICIPLYSLLHRLSLKYKNVFQSQGKLCNFCSYKLKWALIVNILIRLNFSYNQIGFYSVELSKVYRIIPHLSHKLFQWMLRSEVKIWSPFLKIYIKGFCRINLFDVTVGGNPIYLHPIHGNKNVKLIASVSSCKGIKLSLQKTLIMEWGKIMRKNVKNINT